VAKVTKAKQRKHVGKGCRAAVKLAVALIPSRTYGERVVVEPVHGTSRNTGLMPEVSYKQANGRVAHSFCGNEYLQFLNNIFRQRPSTRATSAPLVLVHDRDPSHMVRPVCDFLEARGIYNAILPPRSPDLDPLDYCVFGNAKRVVEGRSASTIEEFVRLCIEFVDKIKSTDAVRSTAGFPSRLKAVKQVQGGHICRQDL